MTALPGLTSVSLTKDLMKALDSVAGLILVLFTLLLIIGLRQSGA